MAYRGLACGGLMQTRGCGATGRAAIWQQAASLGLLMALKPPFRRLSSNGKPKHLTTSDHSRVRHSCLFVCIPAPIQQPNHGYAIDKLNNSPPVILSNTKQAIVQDRRNLTLDYRFCTATVADEYNDGCERWL